MEKALLQAALRRVFLYSDAKGGESGDGSKGGDTGGGCAPRGSPFPPPHP